jgi:hypothetical protein
MRSMTRTNVRIRLGMRGGATSQGFLTLSLRPAVQCGMDRLCGSGAKPGLIWRRRAMADLVYLALGLLFFGLMGAYAIACNRL